MFSIANRIREAHVHTVLDAPRALDARLTPSADLIRFTYGSADMRAGAMTVRIVLLQCVDVRAHPVKLKHLNRARLYKVERIVGFKPSVILWFQNYLACDRAVSK
jgi:hypothetical protein